MKPWGEKRRLKVVINVLLPLPARGGVACPLLSPCVWAGSMTASVNKEQWKLHSINFRAQALRECQPYFLFLTCSWDFLSQNPEMMLWEAEANGKAIYWFVLQSTNTAKLPADRKHALSNLWRYHLGCLASSNLWRASSPTNSWQEHERPYVRTAQSTHKSVTE